MMQRPSEAVCKKKRNKINKLILFKDEDTAVSTLLAVVVRKKDWAVPLTWLLAPHVMRHRRDLHHLAVQPGDGSATLSKLSPQLMSEIDPIINTRRRKT